MIEIEAPDGSIVEFPDGTPKDVMSAAMRKRFNPPPAEPGLFFDENNKFLGPNADATRALGAFNQGLTFGLWDKIGAAIKASPALLDDRDFMEQVTANLEAERQAREQFRQRRPIVAATAEGVGAIAPTMATGGGAASVNTLREAIRTGAGYGAAYGAGSTDLTNEDGAKSTSQIVGDVAANTAFMGTVGAVLPAAVAKGAQGAAAAVSRIRPRPVGTNEGRALAAQRSQDAIDDARAFHLSGVRPFGPAFNQPPVASIAKQVAETPWVGAPLRNNLDETYLGMRNRADEIADAMSPTATPESAGAAVPRGLSRFRNAGLQDLEPGVVQQFNIPPRRAVPPQAAMSQGAIDDAARAAPIRQALGADVTQTTRGVTVPAQMPANLARSRRTHIDDIDDAALGRIVRAPASETSFGTRSEALYERSWRMIPALFKSNGAVNASLLPAVNTRQAAGAIQGQLATAISGQRTLNGDLWQRILNARSGNFTMADLRSIRTEIGRALSGGSAFDQSLDRSQLKALYGAISRDIAIGLDSLANRAAINTQANGAARVTPEVARNAAGALRAFRTADRYFRQGQKRIDSFLSILQARSPEQAAQRLITAAKDGTKGNARLFREAMNALRPEERAEFGALLVRQMGRPRDSAQGIVEEVGFSAQTFATTYRGMRPEVRDLVFTPNHRRALEELYRVANRVAGVEALANTSRTATNALNVTAVTGSAASLLAGNVALPAAIGLSGYATALLMSSPRYTSWLTRYIILRQAVRRGNQGAFAAMQNHLGGLQRMVARNPALAPVIREIGSDLVPGRVPALADSGEAGTGGDGD